MKAGKTFLFKGTTDSKSHLWFTLTDAVDGGGDFLAVPLRTSKSFSDPTLPLSAGDHPFIKHESSVHFSDARIFKAAKLKAALENKTATWHQDASAELMKRLTEGLLKSPYTVPAIREYCRVKLKENI